MQKKLDKFIHKMHNVFPKDIIDKRIVALLVEISEFANEIKPFKYWKKDKTIDFKKTLEEFVDGIHFFASLSIYKKLDYWIEPKIISQDASVQLLAIFKEVSSFDKNFTKEKLKLAFEMYLGLARLYKISDKQIQDVYIQKNKINYKRLHNNY